MTLEWTWQIGAFALAGLALGGLSFAALRLNTELYVAGGLWRSLILHVARLGALAAGLVLAAQQGAGPLLAGAGGLVLARWIAVRALGKVA
jgi:hypothetical protein